MSGKEPVSTIKELLEDKIFKWKNILTDTSPIHTKYINSQ